MGKMCLFCFLLPYAVSLAHPESDPFFDERKLNPNFKNDFDFIFSRYFYGLLGHRILDPS